MNKTRDGLHAPLASANALQIWFLTPSPFDMCKSLRNRSYIMELVEYDLRMHD
jgi:hypothetical protein